MGVSVDCPPSTEGSDQAAQLPSRLPNRVRAPTSPGASFDMRMFMGTRGRERTLSEWRALFDRSGLMLEEVVGLQSFGNILVLRPRE